MRYLSAIGGSSDALTFTVLWQVEGKITLELALVD